MKRKILAMLLALMMVLTLAACGGSSKNASVKYKEEAATEDMVVMESTSATTAGGMADGGYLADMKAEAPMEPASPAPEAEEGQTELLPQKLIRTAWLELETTEFEEAIWDLTELTERYGGYFENSSVANRGNGSRWGNYTIRVPAEKYDAFLNEAGQLCHETWRETSQEDISEVYYDTAGRLKTQQIKLERLQALLTQATAMEDIITIESAISETEWNIDNLSGTLRRYDGKVDYATVHVNLSEVYKLSNVEQVPDTFGQRLGRAFGNGVKSFVNNVEDLVVWIAYNWIGILIWGAVIVGAVVLVRRKLRLPKFALRRKNRAVPTEKTDDKQDET